jgi:hypothetical protein
MKLLFNDELRKDIKKLIDDAQKSIVIISPYIILNKKTDILNSLQHKSSEGIYIEVHTKKDKICKETEINEKFDEVLLSTIYLHDNLHAKAYFNEKKAIVTSMNMLDKSIQYNIEIGYATDNEEEYKTFMHKFYYPCLIYSDIRNVYKKRKYFIFRNLQKIDTSVEIAYDNNELQVSIFGYIISLYFSEEPACMFQGHPKETSDDTIYTQYFYVSSDNDDKRSKLQYFQENSMYYQNILPFHISENGSLCIIYYEASDKYKSVDEILENNERFNELNKSLYQIAKVLQKISI